LGVTWVRSAPAALSRFGCPPAAVVAAAATAAAVVALAAVVVAAAGRLIYQLTNPSFVGGGEGDCRPITFFKNHARTRARARMRAHTYTNTPTTCPPAHLPTLSAAGVSPLVSPYELVAEELVEHFEAPAEAQRARARAQPGPRTVGGRRLTARPLRCQVKVASRP
jgi:hypothetical protein